MADSDDKTGDTVVALPSPHKQNNDEHVKSQLRSRYTTDLLSDSRLQATINNNDENDPPPMTKQTVLGLLTVYFSVLLDMMGMSLVQPVLPFYAEKFGANSFQLGALYSSYSLMATFASYAMGKASDRVK